jgi:hypothetical protein
MEVLKEAADRFADPANRCGSYCGDGSGDGSGYGYGDGSGDGYGYGYGDGSDCGSDCGDGSGNGSGYGYGDGSGYGYGYGYGSGCHYSPDSGYGRGYSDGILSLCGQRVYQIDDVPTLIDHVHGGVAMGRILREDLTTERCYIVKQGSLFAHGETLRAAMEALRDKLLEGMPLEERIEEFVKAHEWGKAYPSADYYGWHHKLTGSCEMGRSEFAAAHGYKLTADELLTVEEFIDLTEGSYGGDIIRRLREAYNKKGGEAT